MLQDQKKMMKILFTAFAAAGGVTFVIGLVLGIAVEPVLFALSGFGVVFLAVGLIPLLLMKKKGRNKEELIQNGFQVEAVIRDVTLNTMLSVNGRNPYRILCEGKDQTGAVQVYTSDNIFMNVPSTVIGEPITVFVSKENPESYYVDIRRFGDK